MRRMNAKKELKDFILLGRSGRFSILCIGNDLRGDDGLGPEIYNRLKNHITDDILLLNTGNQPENFLLKIFDQFFDGPNPFLF